MNILSYLTTGVWSYLIVGVIFATGGGYAVAIVKDKTILELKLEKSQQDTKNTQASLDRLNGFISSMNSADKDYSDALHSIQNEFGSIKSQIAGIKISYPLPPDCKPDARRVRILTDAINKTNNNYTGASK